MKDKQQWYVETEKLIRLYWRSKERLSRLREKERILQLSRGELKKKLNQDEGNPGVHTEIRYC